MKSFTLLQNHVTIFSDHMTIFSAKRKNDQSFRGHLFYFARSGNITCPVAITEKLLSKLPNNRDQHLVCRLASSGSALLNPISYARVREIFRETIRYFVKDSNNFGTHSLKKGGTTASSAAGVSCECLDKHASWKSAKSKESYLSPSLEDKLKLSRAINL